MDSRFVRFNPDEEFGKPVCNGHVTGHAGYRFLVLTVEDQATAFVKRQWSQLDVSLNATYQDQATASQILAHRWDRTNSTFTLYKRVDGLWNVQEENHGAKDSPWSNSIIDFLGCLPTATKNFIWSVEGKAPSIHPEWIVGQDLAGRAKRTGIDRFMKVSGVMLDVREAIMSPYLLGDLKAKAPEGEISLEEGLSYFGSNAEGVATEVKTIGELDNFQYLISVQKDAYKRPDGSTYGLKVQNIQLF